MWSPRTIKCKVCLKAISDVEISAHMRDAHGIATRLANGQTGESRWPFRPTTRVATPTDGKPIHPTQPKQKSTQSHAHGATGRRAKQAVELLGEDVLLALRKGEHWFANESELCDACRRRVVYLDLSGNRQKAFDVGHKKLILGLHVCSEGRGSSVRAYSGGAIDSNRRRH